MEAHADVTSEPNRPRGILKNPRREPEPLSQPLTEDSGKGREVVLQRTAIIQERKFLNAQILESLVMLSEYPLVRSSGCSAASPAAADVDGFKSRVRLFQPSDYDDLIAERNANGLCGYTLCPRPRKLVAGGGDWKLVNKGRKDFNIVRREDVEKWCSFECARRALWIKVQLNETTAWERVGIPSIHIELLGETNMPDERRDGDNALNLQALQLDQRKQVLAQERGDLQRELATGSPAIIGDVVVRERKAQEPDNPEFGEFSASEDEGEDLAVEGYKVKLR